MRRALRNILCVLLSIALATTTSGCTRQKSIPKAEFEPTPVEDMNFSGLNDERLAQYTQDTIQAYLDESFSSDDYRVEDIHTQYVSKEYLEELAFNSQKNIYFGYSLSDIEEQLGDHRYVFTLGEDGSTVVEAREFQGYDDTFNRVATNVAIGGGVILVCVTVTVLTGGAAAPAAAQTINVVFAASAESAMEFALSSAVIGAATNAIVTGYETGDFEAALKSAALGASQGFAIGAITGAITGGVGKAIELGKASRSIRSWKESELKVLDKYHCEDEQVAFLDGERVSRTTKGSTRPDGWRFVDGHYEAIEVKNYDLTNYYSQMKYELKRQIAERVKNLPAGTTQRVCIDVGNRQYSEMFLDYVMKDLTEALQAIDPSVVIEFIP